MRNVFTLAIALLLNQWLVAQSVWKADPNHSKLTFTVTHTGINDIFGLFKTFEAKATTNKADFSDAVFELSVDVASINTEVSMRDDHLRSADFFEVEKYPKMTFASSAIKAKGQGRYELTGNLTLHGVTKPVTMELWYRGTVENPQSKAVISGFQLTGVLKRTDFNIGPKFPAPGISNEVQIKADGEFIKQ